MDSLKEPDMNLLSSTEFSPGKYVRDLSQHCVGGPELRRLRKKIQGLADETNCTLKKNVYQNYMQFIESAKEISHLESEMYQLSHLLSEQKSLLTSLYSTSILGDDLMLIRRSENKENEEEKKDELNREKIVSILEKVEGCKELLEVPDRIYLYEGPLVELDVIENETIKHVQAYLFSDCLMIATRNSRGLMKYVFEAMYELGSLAVVNVKDLGNVKHAFKLLIFPDTRIFKCSSGAMKKEWLEKFDQAKKEKLNHDQKKRESVSEKSPSRSASIDSPLLNSFEEVEDQVISHPDWFLEAPEELDVCVAQRHFEDALTLLQKALEYASKAQQEHVLVEVQRKVEQRHIHITEVLMKELEVSPDKSMQGGLGATRRAVRLLNSLGQSNQACDLFLNMCTSMLRIQCKRIKREGSTVTYVKHITSVVFTNICHMTEEFLKNFIDYPTCYSAYVVWVSAQLSQFANHCSKEIFNSSATSLSMVTGCVNLIRWHCQRLCTYGVDLCYQIEGVLRPYIIRTLKDTRDNYVDSINLKAADESWKPTNLKTKNALSKFLLEYSELGLTLDSFVTGDVWLQLTSNNLAFSKMFLNLMSDCMKLHTPNILHTMDEIFYSIYNAQIRHHELSLREEKQPEQRKFIIKNAQFLMTDLLEVCLKEYQESVDYPCDALNQIQKEYSAILYGVSPTTRNTKAKYSSEFL